MNSKLKEVNQYLNQGMIDSAKIRFIEIVTSEVGDYYEKVQSKNEKVSFFAHYTSVKTIYSILKDFSPPNKNEGKKEPHQVQSGEIFPNLDENENKQDASKTSPKSCLRLYDAFYLNDPNEGKILKKAFTEHAWLKNVKRDTDAFICSFVGGDQSVRDNLTHWHSYGRGGLGCSILLPKDCSLGENCSLGDALHPILYGDDHIERVKTKFGPFFTLGERIHNVILSDEEKAMFATNFWKAFDKVKFMYKNSAYQGEDEFRITEIHRNEKEDGKKIKYDFISEGPYLRRYVLSSKLHANKILTSGTRITIGPVVRKPKRLCKTLKNLAVERGLSGPEFTVSEIPYQKFW